ncbi:ABC transporter substrate-binding protein [Microvirga antarctica]|uniref:ABC transporter substrate-binding protein n=1 Tax=Microvirga antarctica TaxID=2819233 RepID=UPI001B30F33A|nr:ABC transporter substrate-binding protein [Microvirga antarctica]
MRVASRLRTLFAATALMASAFAAQPALANKADSTLRWISRYPIDSIDPYYNTAREALVINGQLVWDTLIWRDPQSGEYKPLLAKEWKWVDDTTLEFTLRDDVKWHDDTPLTADDAVYTFNRVSKTEAKIPVPTNVNWIKGAEKTGPLTFRLFLKQPFPVALEYLSSLLPVLPNNLYGPNGEAPAVEKVVGTGPYKVTSFTPSASISIELTGKYFKDSPKGQPTIKKMAYRVIPDNSTQIAEILSGNADWIWNVASDQAARLASRPGIVVKSVETMRLSFITFNTRETATKNPLADVRVRQAIAHAIDRDKIIKSMVGDGANVPLSACYKTQFGCTQEVTQYKYDPELSKKLLAEAGYPNGVTLDLQAFRSRDWTAAVAGFLNVVGIKTTINYIPYPAAQERLAKGEMQLYLQDNGWLSINDTAGPMNVYFAGDSYDAARDAELTAWVKEAATTVDPEKRKALYDKALKRISDKVYWLSMWTHPNVYAYTQDLDVPLYADENPRFYFAKWK